MLGVSDYLFLKASKKRIPLQGTFELSPVCNFSCKMCYVRKSKEQIKSEGKRIFDWTEWLELGRQCFDAGMLYLLFTGGEPFIYPGFRNLYEALHKMGIVLMINSNGTMIDKETIEWLKTMAPSRVSITLYGASEKTYENLCGVADGYVRAKKAILMLKEAGIPVVINASMIPENSSDLEDIIKFGQENNLNVRMATYMFPPARRECEVSDSRLSSEEGAELFIRKIKCLHGENYKNVLKNNLDKVNLFSVQNDNENWGIRSDQMRCRAGRSTFWVSWDGVMTACGMLPYPVKTYPFEHTFLECWYEINEKVRNAEVMQQCSSCEKKELCHPCVAQIYTETGTVTEKAPYLCEMTDYIISKINAELLDKDDNI